MWAISLHATVRMPIGPLRVLVGAPELHHWHHDRDREAGNYANVSPLMDVLFGTYRCPEGEPQSVGVNEPISKSYLGQLLHPFRRRRQGHGFEKDACAETELEAASPISDRPRPGIG